MNAVIPMIIVSTLALGACSRGEPVTGEPATPDTADARRATARPAIDTQELKSPCAWLTTAEVVQVFGALAGEPQRVGDAENWGADENGEACAYPVTTEYGAANLVVQIDLTGAPGYESVDAMMANVVAQEMPPELQGEVPAVAKAPEGWNYVGWVAGIRVYRVGHVAILMNVTNNRSKDESLDRIALLLRGKILDKPFSSPVNDANLAESSEDPCDLITRAEAESILGKLSVAPYRSLESAPLAHGDGPSCSYYSAGHRVFMIRPDYFDGKEGFNMAAGLGSLVRSNLGGADAADLLDGPWDSATVGTSGELLFLQGDTLLRIYYRNSAMDIEDAAKLAAIAMPRSVKVGSNP
jgi:hypothetical protein